MWLRLQVLVVFVVLSFSVAATAGDEAEADKHFQDGKGFYEQKQYERAQYHLDKAYKLSAKWQYLEYIAKAWLALENYENASYALDAYLRKGGSSIPSDKRTWAKEQLESIKKLKEHQANKKEADAHFAKGRDLFVQKDYEKAAIELEEAYELNPSWEYLDLTGRTEAALKNYKAAIEDFEKFLDESLETATGAQRASVKKALEDVEAAEKAGMDKEEAVAHYEAGKKHLDDGEYDKAVKSLDLAYNLNPTWEYLDSLGKALAGIQSYRRACDAYSAYLQRGGSNVPEGRQAEIKDEIKRLAALASEEMNVEKSKGLADQGVGLLKDGRYAAALDQFEKAYELDPGIGLFVFIAQANEGLGKYHEAITAYKRYLDEGGDGIPKEKRSEIEKRLEALNGKISLRASQAKALSCFKMGVMFFDQELYEKAANEFNRAYEIDPNYQILPRIAATEGALKNYDLAIEKLEKYVKDGGDKLSETQVSGARAAIKRYKALADGAAPEKSGDDLALAPDEYGTASPDENLDAILEPSKADKSAIETGKPAEGAPEQGASSGYDWDPRKRFWTWIVGGVGLGGCAAAIVTGAVAHSEQKKIEKICPGNVCPVEYLESATDRQGTVDNLRLTTRILLIAGGAMVAGGITLFFVEPLFGRSERPAGAQVSLVPVVEGDTAALIVIGRF
jgi:tetratricopeptide (TPR) repeat protein